MEKFMQILNTAEELKITTFHFYACEGIKKLVLEDTPAGEHRRERELRYLKAMYTEAIMNSRDARIGMQRELTKLADIEIWEPERFTGTMFERVIELRKQIADCRAKETQYINAREELK